MSGLALFLISVALYAGIPLLVAARRTRFQFVLLYGHIASVLTLGGLLGAVYVLPLSGDVALLAGQVAYGAFMFSTMVTVIVGRDLQVVRNIIVLTVSVDTLVYLMFRVSQTALTSSGIPDPLGVPSSIFDQSLRIVVSGGILIVAELLLLLGLLEVAKRRLPSAAMAPVYLLAYIGIVTLDGVLFPALVLLPPDGLGAFITASVEAKFLLAVAFSVPLAVFVAAYRPTLLRFEATELHLHTLISASRDDLLESLDRQRTELEENRRNLRRNEERARHLATLARRIASMDSQGNLDGLLDRLGSALAEIPGVHNHRVGLTVEVETGVTAALGSDDPAAPPRHRLWLGDERTMVIDEGPFGPTLLLPLTLGAGARAALEIRVGEDLESAGSEDLLDLVPQLSTLLRPIVGGARKTWTDRAPLLEVIQSSALHIVGQPVIDLSTGRVVLVEALSRFADGTSPSDRFAEAARVGLLVELEQLALRLALSAVARVPAGASLAVNLSCGTFLTPSTQEMLAAVQRPIVVEITENEQVDDYAALLAVSARLPHVRLAVDDTGAGYSSLSHVLRLEPAFVKLDRTLVAGLELDRARRVVVGGLAALALELGSEVIAEGVERQAEADALGELGITLVQGWLVGRPERLAPID
ncbi:EAL domain-containing protein [Pengzhenrongella frigida]|nr:EAL domain-containing protein [Cellulomonas sp. HLT2-17]